MKDMRTQPTFSSSKVRRPAVVSALLTLGLGFGNTATALPEETPPDHVATCTLSAATISNLALDLSGVSNTPNIDFVLVYSLRNNNDGQSLGDGQYTGPVLCTNSRPASADDVGGTVTIIPTNENTPVPNGGDQNIGEGDTNWTAVDIQALEQMLIMQYKRSGLAYGNNTREKKICHTAAGNTDCFIIKPVAP